MMTFRKDYVVLKGKDAKRFLELRRLYNEGKLAYTPRTEQCIQIAISALQRHTQKEYNR